ncbi:thrombospondin type-1 domain-containing protein [Pseudobdellovibrio exovorus]|uniref:Uncharacterized protein n=1 Tax=Pseudobdellovibrio exovorus JSS TaxID=1184267 RepID=M4VMF4_9BACT|nr:thrombospondin type-1 domain-containing protein [Pseudobdellovibrio exovorus]AGH94264.1 hypothetical protein A11Q_44 [Pseudobdellovibrio exovorus JSS]
MSRLRLNTKGIGLLQLLLAVGLGSIVSLAFVNALQVSDHEQRKLQLRNELLAIKNHFASTLHQDQTFLNTIAALENTNMQCLRDRTVCDAGFVGSEYSPLQERLVLYNQSPSPGQIFYDGRATSSTGFTTKGATCTGFSATGAGNSDCPIGFITTWYLSDVGSYKGVALTLNAKMVFNPADDHPLKRFFYAQHVDTVLGSYDIAVTKRVKSLVNNEVLHCEENGVQLNHGAGRVFYQTAGVPVGSRCQQETRLCTIVNNVPELSGTFNQPSCAQACSGEWSACSAPCGGGTQTFTQIVEANEFGPACAHSNGEQRACNTMACGNNCMGDWGACTGGVQRYNVTLPAGIGGDSCPYADGQTRSCTSEGKWVKTGVANNVHGLGYNSLCHPYKSLLPLCLMQVIYHIDGSQYCESYVLNDLNGLLNPVLNTLSTCGNFSPDTAVCNPGQSMTMVSAFYVLKGGNLLTNLFDLQNVTTSYSCVAK